MVKSYLDLGGLTRFLNKLKNIFAFAEHTHTKNEIVDLQTMVISATDDGQGNVVLTTDYVDIDNNTYLVINE